jgi:hypothetical protein
MFVKLRAPDSTASITHSGACYQAKRDGSIEVPVDVAAIAGSFGYRPWTEDAGPAAPPADEPVDQFSGMRRNALFAWLKAHGVKVMTPINYEGLRSACRKAVALQEADDQEMGGRDVEAPAQAETSAEAAEAEVTSVQPE